MGVTGDRPEEKVAAAELGVAVHRVIADKPAGSSVIDAEARFMLADQERSIRGESQIGDREVRSADLRSSE